MVLRHRGHELVGRIRLLGPGHVGRVEFVGLVVGDHQPRRLPRAPRQPHHGIDRPIDQPGERDVERRIAEFAHIAPQRFVCRQKAVEHAAHVACHHAGVDSSQRHFEVHLGQTVGGRDVGEARGSERATEGRLHGPHDRLRKHVVPPVEHLRRGGRGDDDPHLLHQWPAGVDPLEDLVDDAAEGCAGR